MGGAGSPAPEIGGAGERSAGARGRVARRSSRMRSRTTETVRRRDAASMLEERPDPFKGPLLACRVRRVRRFHHSGLLSACEDRSFQPGGEPERGEGETSTATSKERDPRGVRRGRRSPPSPERECFTSRRLAYDH